MLKPNQIAAILYAIRNRKQLAEEITRLEKSWLFHPEKLVDIPVKKE